MIKHLFLYIFLCLVFLGKGLFATDLTNLRIKNAGTFKGLSDGRKMLLNDIHLEYQEYSLKCDTAIVNKTMTRAKLYGRISIWDKQRQINCEEADLYNYKDKTKISLKKNITISKDSLVLKGNNGFFDSDRDEFELYDEAILYYMPENVKIEADKLILNQKDNSFKVIRTKNIFKFDSLYFHKLNGKDFEYSEKDSLLETRDHFTSYSYKHGKKLVLPLSNKRKGARKLEKYLAMLQKVKPVETMESSGGRFFLNFKKKESSFIRRKCFFAYTDSLGSKSTLNCDTVIIKDEFSNFDFISNVEFIKDSIKITSQTTHFYNDEKKFRILKEPKAEFGKAIGLADSIFLWSNDDFNPKKLVFQGESLFKQLSNPEIPEDLDVISGEIISLYWKNSEINLMRVNREAASVYYIYSSEREGVKQVKKLMATNFVTGDSLHIAFENGEPLEVRIFGKSNGDTYPPYLKGKAKENIRKLIKREF